MPPGQGRIALYAWITLGASFLTTALVFGVWFSFAVFFATMVEEFQWSRGGAAVAFSVGNLVQAALSPLIGMLIDRWGPRQVVVWGCVISAVSLAACSTVQTLWHLTVFFGVGVGLGVALAGPVSHSALLAAWFVRRRGTMIGLAFAGMGLGVKILGPLAQYLIVHIGWRHTFLVLAVCTLVYALLIALALRNTPQDVGLQPYGTSTLPSAIGIAGSVAAAPLQDWTVRRAIRTREFWILTAIQMFIPLGIFPIAVHQVAYLADLGFSKVLAAAVLGHMGLMSSCGRMLFGALSDRLGRFGGVSVSIACSQIGILVLLLMHDASVVWPLYVYPHNETKCAIIGGAIYEGTSHPAWRSVYFFGDYCSGEIFAIRHIETAPEIRAISEEFLQIGAVATDSDGEIIVSDFGEGTVYRLELPPYDAPGWESVTSLVQRQSVEARRAGLHSAKRDLESLFSSRRWAVTKRLYDFYDMIMGRPSR